MPGEQRRVPLGDLTLDVEISGDVHAPALLLVNGLGALAVRA